MLFLFSLSKAPGRRFFGGPVPLSAIRAFRRRNGALRKPGEQEKKIAQFCATFVKFFKYLSSIGGFLS
jgi:hypothetical protein